MLLNRLILINNVIDFSGVNVRQRYIRGCLDTIFTSSHSKRLVQKLIPGSNSLKGEHCRRVPRNDLFNNAALRPDNFTLCLCGCDRCNIYPDLIGTLTSAATANYNQGYLSSFRGWICLLVILFIVLLE